jgi:hypothetical protein
MDTNKLAALLQMFAGSGDCEQILKEGAGVVEGGSHQLDSVGILTDVQLEDDFPMRGFTVQIDGQEFKVGVWQEK